MKNLKNLNDGTDVEIRSLTEKDVEKSFEFFKSLPAEDKAYLRVDISKREIVSERLKNVGLRDIKRLVAIIDENIVAEGALERTKQGWESHIAEIRLLISPHFQRKGLGMLMAEELYLLASKEQVEEMIVKVLPPQKSAQSIFKRLGFHEDVTIRNFVKDIKGKKQDLIIMRCDLNALWHELEGYFEIADHRAMHETRT